MKATIIYVYILENSILWRCHFFPSQFINSAECQSNTQRGLVVAVCENRQDDF